MAQNGSAWDIGHALQEYNIPRWGEGYFGINPEGNMTVRPVGEMGPEIDLMKVVREAQERGLTFPLLLRFQDLLRDRVKRLNEEFRAAIAEAEYKAQYRGVFPIKVNQLREVVEEIVDAGAPYHYGIEAGSKPELMAALAMHNNPESLIVCNGYKDATFIQMALLGCKLDKKVILVVEKIEELRAIIDLSDQMGVKPLIGIRVRTRTKGSGKWNTSSGENAGFGLSINDLLEATEILQARKMEDCFRLLHFHLGSQVPDIQTVKKAVREASRYYAKLRLMGFGIDYLDVGGGLGVDYDGTRSVNDWSANYSLSEYARDVVYNIADICDEEKVPHPNIVSESGRAVVTHHSLLVVEVIGLIEKTKRVKPNTPITPAHRIVEELLELKETLNKKNRLEHFHDAVALKNDAETRFNLGLLDLKTMGQVESLFWEIAEEVEKNYASTKSVPKEIRDMTHSLNDQFLCNFSVFQSMIDHWAIDQIFPICPIHRLNEQPVHRATLIDITCDSDGKICKFLDSEPGGAGQDTIRLHAQNGKPYYLGIFLMGAYEDVMGDIHNLFGRVNEAHVFLDDDEESGFYIEETLPGDTIAQVLTAVQYDPASLQRMLKTQVDAAIKADMIKPNEGMRLLESYEQALKSSTYLRS
jgi:arginine decarboxylase